jgi:hypothetical protein
VYVNFLVHIIGSHANDTNILGRSIHAIKKKTEVLVIASKVIGLEVYADKTKYMVMPRDQNAGRSHDIKVDNSCFERVEQFIYLRTTLTNQNSIQEKNKCRLKSQNTCYHSVQNKIYKTAHLKVFTDYWIYPVSLFFFIFPYSKQKSTYTCCLCEAPSVLKEKSCQYKQLFCCSACTFTATVLSQQQFS